MSTNPNTAANTSLEQILLHSSSYLNQKAPNWRKLWTPYSQKNQVQNNKLKEDFGLNKQSLEDNLPRQVVSLNQVLTDPEGKLDQQIENTSEKNVILAAYKQTVEKVRSARRSNNPKKQFFKSDIKQKEDEELEYEEFVGDMRKNVEERMNKYENELQELKNSILKVYKFIANTKNDIENTSEFNYSSYKQNEESKGEVVLKPKEVADYRKRHRSKPQRGRNEKLLEELQSDVEYLKSEVKSTRIINTPKKTIDNSLIAARLHSKSIGKGNRKNSYEAALELNEKLAEQLETNMQTMENLYTMNKEKEKELSKKDNELVQKDKQVSELTVNQ